MKICWDNLERHKIYLSKKGNLRSGLVFRALYIYECKNCSEEFIGFKNQRYCTGKCKEMPKGEKSAQWKGGYNNYIKICRICGKKFKGTKRKQFCNRNCELLWLSYNWKKDKNPNYKHGFSNHNIPYYDTYVQQIDWIEKCRRNTEDINILEIKCTYCGKWFVPKLDSLWRRIKVLKGKDYVFGEHRLYCSDGCKRACPIYGKRTKTLMKEDAIRAGRLNWLELNREVQPELRQMVLKRDDYKCVKCDNVNELHCHHIFPVSTDPLLSADIDNCITLCVECHKEVHQQDGCKYGQLSMCYE